MLLLSVPLFTIEWLVGIVLAVIAFFGSPVIALFVDYEGNLPWGLRHLFQPLDNPCYGDQSWIDEHPNASRWYLTMTYLARNAAYGYQSLVAYPLPKTIKVYGDVYIQDGEQAKAGWYLILGDNGAFEFSFIIKLLGNHCMRGDYGWSLKPLAKGYESVLAGSLQLVLGVRFMEFRK